MGKRGKAASIVTAQGHCRLPPFCLSRPFFSASPLLGGSRPAVSPSLPPALPPSPQGSCGRPAPALLASAERRADGGRERWARSQPSVKSTPGKTGWVGAAAEAAAWRGRGKGPGGCVQGNWCWSWLPAASPSPWRPGELHREPFRSFLLPLPYHPRTARHKVWSFLLFNLSAVIPCSPSLSHHPNLQVSQGCAFLRTVPHTELSQSQRPPSSASGPALPSIALRVTLPLPLISGLPLTHPLCPRDPACDFPSLPGLPQLIALRCCQALGDTKANQTAHLCRKPTDQGRGDQW